MAIYALVVDTTNGRKKARLAGSEADQDFDIGGGGVVEVTVSAFTMDATKKIDVYINGQLTREGGSYDWTRDVGNSKILFNYNVPQNAWVRVRGW